MKGITDLFKKRKGGGRLSVFSLDNNRNQRNTEDYMSTSRSKQRRRASLLDNESRSTTRHRSRNHGGRREEDFLSSSSSSSSLSSSLLSSQGLEEKGWKSGSEALESYYSEDSASSFSSADGDGFASSLSSTIGGSRNHNRNRHADSSPGTHHSRLRKRGVHLHRAKQEGRRRDDRRRKRKQRRKKRSTHEHGTKGMNRREDSHYNRMESLTREELFELPARKLRKKCKKLGLDTSNVAEKEDLVLLIHEYYRSNQTSHRQQHQQQQSHHNNFDGSTSTSTGIVRKGTVSPNNNTPTKFGMTSKSNVILPNDENEQMIEVLFEILPYYGQGDLSIDNIVKDTIQRLPFYCLESRDKLAGNTMLMLSCQIGAIDLVAMLLTKGADVNVQNGNGETCLHFVCYNDSFSPDIAKILVSHGARAEIPERKFGCTPLHWAASLGDIELCSLLCDAGANTRTVDKSGFDPIAYAKQGQKAECVEYLQSKPAIIGDSKDKDSRNNNAVYKGLEDEYGFEKLIDNSTGYAYHHNWKTGESLWEEDYVLFKQSLAKGGLRPIASSFSNRPPPPAHGAKSSKSILENEYNESSKIDEELDTTAQGKDAVAIQRLDTKDFEECDFKQKGEKQDVKGDKESKVRHQHNVSLRNVIGSVDAKIVLSETDEDESSSASSMIEYESAFVSKEKKSNEVNSKKANEAVPSATKNDKDPKDESDKDGLEGATLSVPTVEVRNVPTSSGNVPISSGNAPISSGNAERKMVTQDSFNTRITSLQSRMEEQLNKQLKKMEDKLCQQPSNTETNQNDVSQLQNSVSQLGTKVVELQSILSSKELEIVSLKHQIMSLERDASQLLPKKETVDASAGDGDVREEKWIRTGDVDALSEEISTKESLILDLKEEILNLQMKMKADERDLNNLRENQDRGKDQVLQLESLLKQEKDAKNEVIILLEQTRRGMQVDSDVARSLEEDKRRSDDELNNVVQELKVLKIEKSKKESAHVLELDKHQQKIIRVQEELDSLKEENEKQKERHQIETNEVDKRHKKELNENRESMQQQFTKNLELVEKRLREEKILRMQNEVERNDAVEAYENAIQTTKKAEEEVKRMSAMIAEAKALIGTNEKLHRSLHEEIDKRKALHNHLEDLRGKIRVYVRIRPLNSSESKRNCKEAFLKEDKRTCVLNRQDGSRNECKSWEFDQVFQGSKQNGNSQEDVFKDTKRLITSAIDGFNVCIFAYGQTGSGKTYTMFGAGGEIPSNIGDTNSLNEDLGLAPRVACELFRLIEERQTSFDVSVRMNMFELYNDNVRDLMVLKKQEKLGNDNTLRIKLAEHSKSGLVEVSGAQTETVNSAMQLLDLFRRGSEVRTTASTKMNADSSRSHLITSITISLKNKRTDTITNGKMTLVDLAGSERVGKSGATGNQLKEAQSINKSLSALGDVINALTSGSKHIPYRNHPLTMLMSDSMGGNAKTLMFVCCSPADYNSAETCNALDFAKRCKDVTNTAVKGSTGELGQVKALKAELSRLKRERGDSIRRKNGMAQRPGRKF